MIRDVVTQHMIWNISYMICDLWSMRRSAIFEKPYTVQEIRYDTRHTIIDTRRTTNVTRHDARCNKIQAKQIVRDDRAYITFKMKFVFCMNHSQHIEWFTPTHFPISLRPLIQLWSFPFRWWGLVNLSAVSPFSVIKISFEIFAKIYKLHSILKSCAVIIF